MNQQTIPDRRCDETPPEFVPWSALEVYNTGLLPQVLFAVGILLMAAGTGMIAFAGDIVWIIAGFAAGGVLLAASAVVRSIRQIEAYAANIYHQLKYRNERQS